MNVLKKWLQTADAAIEKLTRWLQGFTTVIVWFMMLIVVLQVIMRYALGMPLDWPLEITEYIMVAMVFLSVAYIQGQKKHIRIEFLFIRLSQKARDVITPLVTLCSLAFFIVLTSASWDYALKAWEHGYRSENAGIPLFPMQAVVPLGSLVMSIQLVRDLISEINTLFSNGRHGGGDHS